jgi:hypothetical protein
MIKIANNLNSLVQKRAAEIPPQQQILKYSPELGGFHVPGQYPQSMIPEAYQKVQALALMRPQLAEDPNVFDNLPQYAMAMNTAIGAPDSPAGRAFAREPQYDNYVAGMPVNMGPEDFGKGISLSEAYYGWDNGAYLDKRGRGGGKRTFSKDEYDIRDVKHMLHPHYRALDPRIRQDPKDAQGNLRFMPWSGGDINSRFIADAPLVSANRIQDTGKPFATAAYDANIWNPYGQLGYAPESADKVLQQTNDMRLQLIGRDDKGRVDRSRGGGEATIHGYRPPSRNLQ